MDFLEVATPEQTTLQVHFIHPLPGQANGVPAAPAPQLTAANIVISGGVRITEPASDLAVLLAVVSSLRNKPLSDKLIVFGEVGLAGEVRPVQRGQERLREAAKLGFKQAIIPAANAPKQAIPGIDVHAVTRIAEAVDWVR